MTDSEKTPAVSLASFATRTAVSFASFATRTAVSLASFAKVRPKLAEALGETCTRLYAFSL